MWSYNYTDELCHGHKYVDRYKGKNGRWVYIYDNPKKDKAFNSARKQADTMLDALGATAVSYKSGHKEARYSKKDGLTANNPKRKNKKDQIHNQLNNVNNEINDAIYNGKTANKKKRISRFLKKLGL